MPEANNNIDSFDRITAYILGSLYQSFPIPLMLETHKVARDVLPLISPTKGLENEQTTTERKAEMSQLLDLINASVNWLERADFIWFDTQPTTEGYSATLTPKALSILKSTPESLQQQRSLGDQMKDLGVDAAKGASSQLVSLAFSAATGNVPALMSTLVQLLKQDGSSSSAVIDQTTV